MNAQISGFGVELAREEHRGPAQDLIVLAKPLVLGLQLFDRDRLFAGDAGAGPIIDRGLREPAPNGLRRDAFLPGERGDYGGQGGVLLEVLPDEPHAPRAQLGIDLLRHAVHPSGLKQQRHQTRADSVRQRSVGSVAVEMGAEWTA